jgi:hypothetical protein
VSLQTQETRVAPYVRYRADWRTHAGFTSTFTPHHVAEQGRRNADRRRVNPVREAQRARSAALLLVTVYSHKIIDFRSNIDCASDSDIAAVSDARRTRAAMGFLYSSKSGIRVASTRPA